MSMSTPQVFEQSLFLFQVLLGEEEDGESKEGAMSPIYKSVDGGSSAGGGKTLFFF